MSFGRGGFQDGQRVTTLDATAAAWTLSGTFNIQKQSGAIATQGYEHTLISILLAGGNMAFDWSASLDQAGVQTLFSERLILDAGTLGLWCVTLPNLGPYLHLSTNTLISANYTVQALFALLTNKARPLSSIPGSPFWEEASTGQAALATSDRPAPFYWTGPVTFTANSGSTSMEFALQALDATGTWTTFWQQNPAASTIIDSTAVVFPLAPVRLHTINLSGTTANNNWTFCAVPDQKGI